MRATQPSNAVHLIGAFDQYVLGAGTQDAQMLPSQHRPLVSKAAGWIAPVVLDGGRIVGVWEVNRGDVSVAPFPGTKKPSNAMLMPAIRRIAALI
ncbi:MAG: DNA glycosylase AlkZ-like family protein [Actinomycetota bacterium]